MGPFLVWFLALRFFWGPPPALAAFGRMKLNSKVLPTVRVCGECPDRDYLLGSMGGVAPRVQGVPGPRHFHVRLRRCSPAGAGSGYVT